MMFRKAVFMAIALAACAPATWAEQDGVVQDVQAPEASIPFVNHRVVDDFRADGNQAVYLRVGISNWYRARLMSPCLGLPYAERIAIETRGPDTLDRYATLLVGDQRCPLESLVKSDPPSQQLKKPAMTKKR